MKKQSLWFAMFILSMLLVASVANAQATRTWVSGVGDDVNPCSRTAPCKTFAGAISKTATGGEINVLDAGGFGTINIIKSITIDGGESFASILNSGTTGVIVNTPANAVVTLRNIEINGAGTGTKGIRFIGQGTLNIDNVHIYGQLGNLTARCIEITPNASSKVNITNTIVHECNEQAIFSQPTAGTATVVLDNVIAYNNRFSGFDAVSNTVATVSNSKFFNNGGAGVFAELGSATVNVYNCVLSNNTASGITSGNLGAPVIRVGHSFIVNNTNQGLALNGGTILSWGDNYIEGNGGNQTPSPGGPTKR